VVKATFNYLNSNFARTAQEVNTKQVLGEKMSGNALKEIRESLMISKTEFARKSNISALTLTRVEKGKPCRIETKRKILLALGVKISDKNKVFH
jgi:predicted transcriptional regulator